MQASGSNITDYSRLLYYLIREIKYVAIKYVAEHIPHHSRQ